jgi:hypothetical protein
VGVAHREIGTLIREPNVLIVPVQNDDFLESGTEDVTDNVSHESGQRGPTQ